MTTDITNLANIQSVGSQVGALLGLNNWQLTTGKYNGCTFCTFAPLPVLQSNPIYQSGLNAISVINQFTGLNILGTDPNGNGQLFDTVLGLISMQEEYIPQTVIKPLPFAGRTNTERLGGGGYEFKFTLLYVGQDYLKAAINVENAIKNPPKQQGNYLVLEHPTRGVIKGVVNTTSWSINSNVGIYNGCIIQFSVRAEQSNIADLVNKNKTQLIFNAINSALSLVLSINSTIDLINTVTSDGQNLYGNSSNLQANSRNTVTTISNLTNSVHTLTSKLFANVNYVYKKSPTPVSISQLDNTPINVTDIPIALNTGTTLLANQNYNATQGEIVLQYYVTQVATVMTQIDASGLSGQANDLINQINESVSALYNVCNLCAQIQTRFAYLIPTNMSLYEALFRNGFTFDYAQAVMTANPQIQSANYLPQGMVITL